ncbi:hypothetical protein RND71_001561 [Anisodus tanguticus]|uniref:Uncharacterized protein n=1 Tax=Anisodus tanguticus TaxID=243964 RepID=A0AAE1T157_9SOLA|nr:hypothetical protein RND71_001561 [Anisodus tanguticus]
MACNSRSFEVRITDSYINHDDLKKPDIFELIQAAVGLAEWKYPAEFNKHKDELVKLLMNPGKLGDDEYDDADLSAEFEQQIEAIVHEKNPTSQEKHHKETSPRFQENYNSTVTSEKQSFKKTDIDADTQGKNMNSVTSMSKNYSGDSRKIQVSIKKHKGTEEFENRTTTTGVPRNAAIKRVEVAPPRDKQFIGTCSGQKRRHSEGKEQNNYNIVGKDSKKRLAMDFESSKRKFEERFAEQNKAKRRMVMVDFHDMPKPAKDTKRCWDRRRF